MNVVERGRHKDNNKSLLVRYSVSLIYNNATRYSGVGLVLHCQGTSSGHLLSLAVYTTDALIMGYSIDHP
jgi:hypothetical protein